MKKLRHFARRALTILAVPYLVILIAMIVFENSLIYFPSSYPRGRWQEVEADDRIEEAWITAQDGTKVHGLYLPHAKPRGVLLYFHGNAGNVTHRIGRIRRLNQHFQLSVLGMDYRGYGKSEGSPHEKGLLLDAVAASEWLAKREKISTKSLIFLGRSLGGGVAVQMAARYNSRALIIESTFTSLPDVAARQYPWLPVRLFMRNQLNSLNEITNYQGPVLQSHGTADRVVAFSLGKRLHAAIPGRKTFVTIQGGGHNDPLPPSYYTAFKKFLDELK